MAGFAILNYIVANHLIDSLDSTEFGILKPFKFNTAVFFFFAVVGEWSEWLPAGKCRRDIFGNCYMSMSRHCTSAGSRLSMNAHCDGQSFKRSNCLCWNGSLWGFTLSFFLVHRIYENRSMKCWIFILWNK